MRDSGGNLLGSQIWNQYNVGGLGFVTGLVLNSAGMYCRTDVGGAYRWSASAGKWIQMISTATMTLPDPLTTSGNRFGVYELSVGAGSSTVLYMAFRSRALRSADGGLTWADTSLNGTTGVYMGSNDQSGGVVRLVASKLVQDPSNDDVVYLGTQRDGLWRRMSGTWATIASVPAATGATDADKVTIVTVDPTSATTGSGGTLRRSIVYASSNGNGIYKSTDGGSTFALMTGHPGAGASYNAWFLNVDSTGLLWLCLRGVASQNVYTWNGTVWTQLTLPFSQLVRSVRVDPKNASRWVMQKETGCPTLTLDGGSTFKVWNTTNQTAIAENIPIIPAVLNATFGGGQSASFADIIPHPVENYDYVPMGLGVCRFAVPWPATVSGPPNQLQWIEHSAGIEELVANHIHITPNKVTIVGSQDKALIKGAGISSYPAGSYPASALDTGFGIDYAIDNNNWIAGIANNQGGGKVSGISVDGGASWNAFSTQPSNGLGGSLAVGNAGNIVFFPGQNNQPKVTHNSGVSWALPTFTGWTVPADGTTNGFGFGTSDTRRHICCADKANAGTFYCYNYGAPSDTTNSTGIWKSTDSGDTWNRVNTTQIINALFIGFHVMLQMDRGVMYLVPGESGDSFDGDTVNLSYRSEDGGVTWTALGQLYEINCLAIGKPVPGNSFHTLYALGWKSTVFGLYRSVDKGATWTAITNNTTFDHAYCMAADPTVFGRIVAGYTGTGYAESDYSYKLRLKAS